MKTTESRYNLSFTTASFLYRDSVLLATLYLSTRDWNMVRELVLRDNLLQIRTLNAQKRIYSETYTRIMLLSDAALDLIANAEREIKVQIIWSAICKKYTFIKDFSVMVISEKLKIADNDLSEADFYTFFNNQAITHDELGSLARSTVKKLHGNLFRMLRSAGILDNDGKLSPLRVFPEVQAIVAADEELTLQILPGYSL